VWVQREIFAKRPDRRGTDPFSAPYREELRGSRKKKRRLMQGPGFKSKPAKSVGQRREKKLEKKGGKKATPV